MAIIPLTNPTHEPTDSLTDIGDDPKLVGAPACEIEITPEMIEAGEAVLFLFDTSTADEAYWAKKVYTAMSKSKVYSSL